MTAAQMIDVPLDQEVMFLFSTDGGPRGNLEMLREPAKQARYHVVFPTAAECTAETAESLLRQFLPRKIVVITGLSSFKNQVELKIGEIVKILAGERHAIEWWILADTHYAGLRPPAKEKISHARGVFPATMAEMADYSAFGYARIYYVGGPPKWQEFWRTWPVEVKQRVPGRPLEYYGGVKAPELSNEFLIVCVTGANLAYGGTCDHVIRLHPAEDGKPQEIPAHEWTKKRVTELMERGLVAGNVILDADPKFTSAELTITADDSFSTGGGTDGIVAAMHRRRAYFWETEEVRKRNVIQIGREEWYPAEKGALVKVATSNDVARAIERLRDYAERGKLAETQRRIYPTPSKSELEQPIAANILDCLKNPAAWM